MATPKIAPNMSAAPDTWNTSKAKTNAKKGRMPRGMSQPGRPKAAKAMPVGGKR